MKKVLIIAAHGDPDASRISRAAIERFKTLPEVTVNELTRVYPDGRIDVAREQALLNAHDAVVLLFPVWWFSSPAILKQWQDDVLSYGFAYGSEGTALHGKPLLVMASTGGDAAAYADPHGSRFPINDLLLPFHGTARFTGMVWQPPALLQGANALTEEVLAAGLDGWLSALHRLQNPA